MGNGSGVEPTIVTAAALGAAVTIVIPSAPQRPSWAISSRTAVMASTTTGFWSGATSTP